MLEEIYFDNCKFTVHGRKGFADEKYFFFENVKGLHLNNTTFDISNEGIECELLEKQ